MDKKHANSLSDNALDNVSGGVGMANPYNTPEKKQAYNDLKKGKITKDQFASIMGLGGYNQPQ